VGGSTSRYVPRNEHSIPSGGLEDDVVVTADPQVDRALRHLVLEGSEPVAHVLRLRERVEDERERSVELSRGEDLQLGRELDDRRSVPIGCFHRLSFSWSSLR
jgi:hypothetical protein